MQPFVAQPPRPDRLSVELPSRTRPVGHRQPRAARQGDPARLRDEGAGRLGHPGAHPRRPLREPLRPDARRRAEPFLGRPVRAHHVREAGDALGRRAAPAQRRLHGDQHAVGRRRREDCRRPGGVRRAAGGLGRRGRGPDLRGPVRRLRPSQAARDGADRGEADDRRGRSPTRRIWSSGSPATTRTSRRSTTTTSSTAPRNQPELEALHRWAMVLHNQYPWDRARHRNSCRWASCRRTTTSSCCCHAASRCAASCAGCARRGTRLPRPRAAQPADARRGRIRRSTCAEQFAVHAADRGDLRGARRDRLHQRGSDCATPPTTGRRCRRPRSSRRPGSSSGSTPA